MKLRFASTFGAWNLLQLNRCLLFNVLETRFSPRLYYTRGLVMSNYNRNVDCCSSRTKSFVLYHIYNLKWKTAQVAKLMSLEGITCFIDAENISDRLLVSFCLLDTAVCCRRGECYSHGKLWQAENCTDGCSGWFGVQRWKMACWLWVRKLHGLNALQRVRITLTCCRMASSSTKVVVERSLCIAISDTWKAHFSLYMYIVTCRVGLALKHVQVISVYLFW